MRPHWHNADGEALCEQCAPDEEGDLNSNETDVPENCAVCGRLCEYTLTADGVKYVLDHAREELERPADKRNAIRKSSHGPSYYDGSRQVDVVRDWVEDLQWYALSAEDAAFVVHFLAETAPENQAGPEPQAV